jgi:hypothetical protein
MDAQPEAPAVDARVVTAAVIGAIAAILALATALRFTGLELGLPHWGARPDERPILEHTVLVANGHFDYDWSVYPHAYVYLHWLWGEVVLQIQYWLGASPTADYAQVWQKEPARLHAIGRALTALAGVATVALVIASTRRAFGRVVAVVAGLWLAVCFLHVRDAHALKPDVLMGLFVTAAIVASAALANRPTIRSGVVAGLCVGAAAAAKYNGIVAAVPVCAAAWLGSRDRGLRRWLPPPLLAAGGTAALFFAATSPFVLVNPSSLEMLRTILAMVFPGLVEVSGEAASAVLGLEGPAAPDWAARFGSFGTAVYHGGFSLRYGIGLLATLIAPMAVVWGLLSRVWLARMSAILCIAWYPVVSLSPVMLSRYITPMLPAVAILEAGMLVALVRRYCGNSPRQMAPILALGSALLVAEPLWSAIQYDRIASRTDTRVLASEWLRARAPRGSRVAIEGTKFWPWGAPQLPPGLRAVPLESGDRRARRNVEYLLTHDHELFWSSVDPELIERNASRLALVADFDPGAGAQGEPVFEVNDAYYIPIHGFAGVSLPGPRVRIYRVR